MKQEDKELLVKDLCARLPYKVIINVDVLNIDCLLCAVYQNKEHPDCVGIGDNGIASIERVKPYLRPMSSMTEEECKELGNLPATIENVGETLSNIPYYIEVARPEQLDWLNAHHFDYRGLIEKGLAIEAPKGMYEY